MLQHTSSISQTVGEKEKGKGEKMEEQHRKRRLTSPIPGALAAGSPQKKVLLSAGSDAAAPGDSKAAAVKADADESEATSLDQRLGLEDGFLEVSLPGPRLS